MVKIFLVDDEPLLLESLEIVLTVKGGFEVIGSAGNGTEALKKLKEKTPDVMLIDLNMPGMGGIELIKRVKEEYPDIRMIVLTTFYDDRNISEALANGASGYLLKDSGKDAIIEAVEQSVKGVSILDAKVMQKLTGILNNSGTASQKTGTSESKPEGSSADETEEALTERMNKAGLTEREKEIAKLIAEGCTNSQISSMLFISKWTVKK